LKCVITTPGEENKQKVNELTNSNQESFSSNRLDFTLTNPNSSYSSHNVNENSNLVSLLKLELKELKTNVSIFEYFKLICEIFMGSESNFFK
jgi:hypothetical protein